MHIVYFITWPITHRWTVDGTNGTISTRSLFPVAHLVRPLPAVLDRSPLRTLQLALRKSHPRNFARLPSARWRRVATLGGGLGRTAAPPSPPSIAPKTCTNKGTFGRRDAGRGKKLNSYRRNVESVAAAYDKRIFEGLTTLTDRCRWT